MSYVAKEYLTDCSTPDEFCFSLRCAECGEVWKSAPVKFSKSGVMPASSGKRIVYDTLYRREKETAMNRAAGELRAVFNECPICRRAVCDHCFFICEELDMCASCAHKLQERGEPVAIKGSK